jgi:PRTRC genetic system ThiF family protein
MNVFDPHAYLKHILIVGIGGTGANVARIVGRILYDMQRRQQQIPALTLIDPDVVESKNVGRQLFSPAHIGMYKAHAISTTLNLALGLETRWIAEAFDPQRHLERYGSHLILSCVDNHEARQAIHRANGIVISAGNHADGGQVVIGNTTDADLMRQHMDGRDGKYRYLPTATLLLPELLQPEAPTPTPIHATETTASCAELVQAGEQHLLVNDFMASVVGQYTYQILHRQPITSFLTYISSTHLTMTSKPISRAELEVYLG